MTLRTRSSAGRVVRVDSGGGSQVVAKRLGTCGHVPAASRLGHDNAPCWSFVCSNAWRGKRRSMPAIDRITSLQRYHRHAIFGNPDCAATPNHSCGCLLERLFMSFGFMLQDIFCMPPSRGSGWKAIQFGLRSQVHGDVSTTGLAKRLCILQYFRAESHDDSHFMPSL